MENQEKMVATSSKLKKIAMWFGILSLVFMLGYIPSYLNIRQVEQQNNQLKQQVELSELQARLGMMSYELNRNNYSIAAQHSTYFFNGLRQVISQTKDQAFKQKLETFLEHRDEVTTNLVVADPIIKEKVAKMYADFYQLNKEVSENREVVSIK